MVKGRALVRPSERSERFEPFVRHSAYLNNSGTIALLVSDISFRRVFSATSSVDMHDLNSLSNLCLSFVSFSLLIKSDAFYIDRPVP